MSSVILLALYLTLVLFPPVEAGGFVIEVAPPVIVCDAAGCYLDTTEADDGE